jgi:hypothetical protein
MRKVKLVSVIYLLRSLIAASTIRSSRSAWLSICREPKVLADRRTYEEKFRVRAGSSLARKLLVKIWEADPARTAASPIFLVRRMLLFAFRHCLASELAHPIQGTEARSAL